MMEDSAQADAAGNEGDFSIQRVSLLLPFQHDMYRDIMEDVDALLVTGMCV